MADFKLAQPYIIKNEGGWNHVDGDDETYLGINRKSNPSWSGWAKIDAWKKIHGTPKYNQIFSENEIPGLSADADLFYKINFWDTMKGDGIAIQSVAAYFYDFYVNAMRNATKVLQTVCGTTPDGSFGNGTLAAVNGYSGDLLKDLDEARRAYYERIGVGSKEKFLKGWLNRCDSMYKALSDGDASAI